MFARIKSSSAFEKYSLEIIGRLDRDYSQKHHCFAPKSIIQFEKWVDRTDWFSRWPIQDRWSVFSRRRLRKCIGNSKENRMTESMMKKHSSFLDSHHFFLARELFWGDKVFFIRHRHLKTRQRLVDLLDVFNTEYRYRSKWLFVFSQLFFSSPSSFSFFLTYRSKDRHTSLSIANEDDASLSKKERTSLIHIWLFLRFSPVRNVSLVESILFFVSIAFSLLLHQWPTIKIS